MFRHHAVFSVSALPFALVLASISQCNQPPESPLADLEVVPRITAANANLMPPVPEDPLSLQLSVDYYNGSPTTTMAVEQVMWFELESIDGTFYATLDVHQITDENIVLEPGESAKGVPYMKGATFEVRGDYPCGREVMGTLYAAATVLDVVYEEPTDTGVVLFTCTR